MRLMLFFAMRYLFSRKSTTAINIISLISMAGMMVGAMALIVILSVYNGFEGLVLSLYNVFNPDLMIKPASGKVMMADEKLLNKIRQTEGVANLSLSLEENAYLRYNGKEYIGVIKGVDKEFQEVAAVPEYMLFGDYLLQRDSTQYAILGAGVDAALGAYNEQNPYSLQVFMPKRGKKIAISPDQLFASGFIQVSGVFAIQSDFDNKYVLAPLSFVRQLLRYYDGEVSQIEVKLSEDVKADAVREELKKSLGEDYLIQTRIEQNAILYRVMRIERWAVIAILAFVLLIISFNMIGSLSMLVLEKKKDISIMHAMGFRPGQIRSIFWGEGILMGLLGALLGMGIGTLICLVQIYTGIVPISGSSFVTDSYPVELHLSDYFLTLSIILLVSALAGWIPAVRAARSLESKKEE